MDEVGSGGIIGNDGDLGLRNDRYLVNKRRISLRIQDCREMRTRDGELHYDHNAHEINWREDFL